MGATLFLAFFDFLTTIGKPPKVMPSRAAALLADVTNDVNAAAGVVVVAAVVAVVDDDAGAGADDDDKDER